VDQEVLPDALVLDAALRQSLVTVRSLGLRGVRVHAFEATSHAPAFASRYCSTTGFVPSLENASHAFVDAVIELAKRFDSPVVISSHDGAIEALSRRRDELDGVSRLALAAPRALAIALDKRRTLEHAVRLGIDIPWSITVTDAGEVRDAAAETGFPIVLKPVQSWASDAGVGRRLAPSVQLDESSLVRATHELVEAHGAAIVQPWLSGAREAVSVVCAGGEVRAAFAQVARRVDPLLGGLSVMRTSIPLPPDLTKAADGLVRSIGLEGYSEIEFRRDGQGRAKLMEINPRLSASVEVAVRAGVDFPHLLYEWARGAVVPRVKGYRVGVRMRWLGGDIRWLARTITSVRHPDANAALPAVREFLGDFLRPTHYDYLDVRDLSPAAVAVAGFGRSLLSQAMRG
jgi:predicted ATP-grasp superfamily ATP-dependent carboligase